MRFLLPVRSALTFMANIRSATAMSAVAAQDDCTAADKDNVSATGCDAAIRTAGYDVGVFLLTAVASSLFRCSALGDLLPFMCLKPFQPASINIAQHIFSLVLALVDELQQGG